MQVKLEVKDKREFVRDGVKVEQKIKSTSVIGVGDKVNIDNIEPFNTAVEANNFLTVLKILDDGAEFKVSIIDGFKLTLNKHEIKNHETFFLPFKQSLKFKDELSMVHKKTEIKIIEIN